MPAFVRRPERGALIFRHRLVRPRQPGGIRATCAWQYLRNRGRRARQHLPRGSDLRPEAHVECNTECRNHVRGWLSVGPTAYAPSCMQRRPEDPIRAPPIRSVALVCLGPDPTGIRGARVAIPPPYPGKPHVQCRLIYDNDGFGLAGDDLPTVRPVQAPC